MYDFYDEQKRYDMECDAREYEVDAEYSRGYADTYGRGKIRGYCYGCEKRHSECHSTCKDYLNEVAERMAKGRNWTKQGELI